MTTETQEKIWTLHQLNRAFKNLVDTNLGGKRFWVDCEIAQANESRGHWYIELVQADLNDQSKALAKAKANLWRSTVQRVDVGVKQVGMKLEDLLKVGNKIRISCSFNYTVLHGLSLAIHDIDPNATLGDIEKQKQQTLERIKNEGLEVLQKRLYLSPIVKRIAIVGSPDTSGFADFINGITTNQYFRNITYKVFPTSVQGEHAVDQISSAIEEAARHDADLIVVIRGGGSKMDLHIFNHYNICRAIAYSRIPVVSGVGHETDSCLVDFVCFRTLKTPTAAAEWIYLRSATFRTNLEMVLKSIHTQTEHIIDEEKLALQSLKEYFVHAVKRLVDAQKETLSEFRLAVSNTIYDWLRDIRKTLEVYGRDVSLKASAQIDNADKVLKGASDQLVMYVGQVISNQRQLLGEQLQRVKGGALYTAGDQRKELENRWNVLKMRVGRNIEISWADLLHREEILHKVDPTKLFEKGYTISTVDGVDLNRCKGNLEGKALVTYSDKYELESTIRKTKER